MAVRIWGIVASSEGRLQHLFCVTWSDDPEEQKSRSTGGCLL